jgi:transcriptional regulator with XRE-family HTH domain
LVAPALQSPATANATISAVSARIDSACWVVGHFGNEILSGAATRTAGSPNAASILRNMRKTLGISQLELALRLGMSQRHIGFVELGRSRPSLSLILNWTRETCGTIDERNAALVSAGYSPVLLASEHSDCRSSAEFRALLDMLRVHEPNPGIIFDADWIIRAMSDGGRWFCGTSMPGVFESKGTSWSDIDMIAAVAHPAGLLSKAVNAAEVGYALLRQLRLEELIRPSLKPRVDALELSLVERFGRAERLARAPGVTHLQIILDTEFGLMKFLLVQTVFGLPQNVSQNSLRSELWFPVDDATKVGMATRGRASLAARGRFTSKARPL